MANLKFSKRIRALDAIVGLVILCIGLWIIVNQITDVQLLLRIFSLGLLAMGLVRIAKGAIAKGMTREVRMSKIATGIVALICSVLVELFPDITLLYLVGFIAFALILLGLGAFVVGAKEKTIAIWWRILQVVIGAITAILGVFILFSVSFGYLVLGYALGSVLIFNGGNRVFTAITGKAYNWLKEFEVQEE